MKKRIEELLEGKESNYILPFLWQHGEEEKVIREEIARVHEAGIGAVCVESRPHPEFLGPKWWKDMDVIIDEAKARGMKIWFLDDDHFPTGHAAGKVKEAPVELHRLFLSERYVDTIGPAQGTSLLIDTILMNGIRPSISATQYATDKNKFVSAVAVRRDAKDGSLTEEKIDITEFVKDGILYWNIPDGYWRVFIISETRHGGSKGQADYLNPIDKESARILLDTVYEAFYERYKDDFGKTIAGFFSDEPGFYNDPDTFNFESKPGKSGVPLPWSRDMPDLLEQALGHEYKSLLYLLWHETGEQSDRVRYAYMNIVSKLYSDHFCGQIGSWCRARGVEYIGHVLEDNNVHARLGSGAGHFFRSLWGQDMSGVDVVLWQIVPGFDELPFRQPNREIDSEFFHYGLAKLAVSLGHIDPKKKGRTMCELYGAYGWAEGLKLMKWLTDHMLVRGVNYFVPHSFTQKAFPDPDHPPHMYAEGKNPQYRYYKYLNNYMNRISHLISEGRHIATAAVLYHAEAEWSGEAMYFQKPLKQLMQRQIDADVVPIDVLLDEASVKERKLHINIEAYECLIIPYGAALPVAMISCLVEFAEQGLSIRFVEGLPLRSSEGIDVAAELASLAKYENVKISNLKEIAEDLLLDNQYDIKVDQYEPYLRSYHYIHDDLDVFMFFNEDPMQTINTKVMLPVQGEVCAYDAFLNTLTRIAEDDSNGAKTIQLELQPYESIVLLHGADIEKYAGKAYPDESYSTTEHSGMEFSDTHYAEKSQQNASSSEFKLEEEWIVAIATSEQYPHFQTWGSLSNLTNLSAANYLPRFTGTFRYELEFEFECNTSASKALLDLGAVYETAEVWLNDEHVGVRICPPYRLEINGLLKQGKNKLVVEVTNTLAKDQQDFLSTFVQQEPSGLIGPVRIINIK